MSFSAYEMTVPVFARGLSILRNYVDVAETLLARGMTVGDVMSARLAPDMLSLVDQVRVACNKAERHTAQLAQQDLPKPKLIEPTFDAIRERLDEADAFLKTIPDTAIVGAETRTYNLSGPLAQGWLDGRNYILELILPDFFFHITTVHNILRNAGAEIGKRDYLGPLDMKHGGYD